MIPANLTAASSFIHQHTRQRTLQVPKRRERRMAQTNPQSLALERLCDGVNLGHGFGRWGRCLYRSIGGIPWNPRPGTDFADIESGLNLFAALGKKPLFLLCSFPIVVSDKIWYRPKGLAAR